MMVIGFFLICGSLYAKNFGVSPSGKVIDTSVTVDKYCEMIFQLPNTTISPIDLSWTVLENSMNANWDYTICDWQNCFAGLTLDSIRHPAAVDAGLSGFLKLSVDPAMVPDRGIAKIKVYETADSANADTLTFIVNAKPVGIEQAGANQEASVYYDPLRQVVFFRSIRNDRISGAVVYNVLGKQVLQITSGLENGTDISLSGLPSGLYFIALSQGNVREPRWFKVLKAY